MRFRERDGTPPERRDCAERHCLSTHVRSLTGALRESTPLAAPEGGRLTWITPCADLALAQFPRQLRHRRALAPNDWRRGADLELRARARSERRTRGKARALVATLPASAKARSSPRRARHASLARPPSIAANHSKTPRIVIQPGAGERKSRCSQRNRSRGGFVRCACAGALPRWRRAFGLRARSDWALPPEISGGDAR